MVNQEILEGIKFAFEKGSSLKDAMMSFYNSGYKKEEIEEAVRELYKLSPQNPAFKQQDNKQESSQMPKTSENQVQKNTENLVQQTSSQNIPFKQESSSLQQKNIPSPSSFISEKSKQELKQPQQQVIASNASVHSDVNLKPRMQAQIPQTAIQNKPQTIISKEPPRINSHSEKQPESIFPHKNPESLIKSPEYLNTLENREQNIKLPQTLTTFSQHPNLGEFETQKPSQKFSENSQIPTPTISLTEATPQTNELTNPALEIPEQEKEIPIPPLPPLPSMQDISKKTGIEQKQNPQDAQENQKTENKTIQKVSNYSESASGNKSKNQILILSLILAVLAGTFVVVLIFRDRITNWVLSLFSS